MIKQKKIILIILIFVIVSFIFLKLLDYFFQKKYGLGNPVIYEKSKIYGYKLKPNQNIKRRGKNIIINNFGMRSSEDWELNNNKKKIIFFGDSITYGGSIVNNGDLFSEKVCEKLNQNLSQFSCGNLAVNGYNVYSIIRSIKYKEFDNEDLIIITLIGNDFVRTFHNVISQPFWSKEIDNFFPAITEIVFILIDRFRNKIKYNLGSEKNFKNIDLKYYNDLIDELNIVLLKNSKPFIIFYSPSIQELKNQEDNRYFKKILQKKFKNFYDMSEIVYSNKDNLFFDHIHLNQNGHEIYSDYISNKIKKIFNK